MDSTTQHSEDATPLGEEVVLVLKSAGGDYFNTANRVLAAQAAGFEFSESAPTTLALLSRDTREDIAVMKVDGFKEAVAELATIVISMNPYTCPVEWACGDRLTGSVDKFARLMNAKICDEAGNNMEQAAFVSLGKQIDLVIKKRRESELKEYPRATMPDGTVRIEAYGLSFVADYETKRGRHLRVEYFDVPPLDYHKGAQLGLKLAAEFLEFIRTHREHRYWYERVLQDAFKVLATENFNLQKPGRYSAASEFVRAAVIGSVIYGARHSSFGPWIADLIQANRRAEDEWNEYLAKEKREFVERMQTARAKKRASLEAPAASVRRPVAKAKRAVAELV